MQGTTKTGLGPQSHSIWKSSEFFPIYWTEGIVMVTMTTIQNISERLSHN